MYRVSDKAIQAYKDDGRQKRRYFSYDDVILTSFNAVSSSFSISDSISTGDSIAFGTASCKEMSVTFSNKGDEIKNIANKKLKVYNFIEIENYDYQSIKQDGGYSILVLSDTEFLQVKADSNEFDYYKADGDTITKKQTINADYQVYNLYYIRGVLYASHKYIGKVTEYNFDGNLFTRKGIQELTTTQSDFIDGNQNNIFYDGTTYKEFYLFTEYTFEYVPECSFYTDRPERMNERELQFNGLDSMSLFDRDVSDWWNNLTFPTTVKSLLNSLCSLIGVPYDGKTFPNDTMSIPQRTSTMSGLKGRDMLMWIGQVSARFPKITREDKLTLVKLETDYAESDLPVLSTHYQDTLTISEFIVEKITKVQVQTTDSDIGVIVGEGENTFIITDNPLMYSMKDDDLRPFVEVILNEIKDVTYIPFEMEVPCQYYLDAGDLVLVETKGQKFVSYILERSISGYQALSDKVVAKGTEKREAVTSDNLSVVKLYGKTNELERTVEETKSTLTDNMNGLQSQITQQAGEINLTVQNIHTPNMLLNSAFNNGENNWNLLPSQDHAIVEITEYDGEPCAHLQVTELGNYKAEISQDILVGKKLNKVYLSVEANVEFISDVTYAGIGFYAIYEDNTSEFPVSSLFKNKPIGKWFRVGYTFSFKKDKVVKSISAISYNGYVKSGDGISVRLRKFFMQELNDTEVPNVDMWNDLAQTDIVSSINMTNNQVKISADKVDITGVVTFNDLATSGQSIINGDNIKTGTLSAIRVQDLQSINGVPINATGDVTVINWDGRTIKLHYNNGIVTGWNFADNSKRGMVNQSYLYVNSSDGNRIWCSAYFDGNGGVEKGDRRVVVYNGLLFADGIVQ